MHTILIVDEEADQTTAAKQALQKTYTVVTREKGRTAIDYLKKVDTMPSLVIMAIEMSPMTGFEVYNWMRANEKTKTIPVIFVTKYRDPGLELEAYGLGAVDFLYKPYLPDIMLRKVELHTRMLENNNALLQEKDQLLSNNTRLQSAATMSMHNVINMQQFIVGIMTDLITKKDGFTGTHSKKVSRLMQILMMEMVAGGTLNIKPEDQSIILLGAQLFDMGKIGVPDEILSKVGKYTNEEFSLMKQHTIFAAETIQKFSYLLPNNNFVMYTYHMCRSHHEQWCGKGYPDGLAGENIPILARMVSLCDIYDALVSERPYKKPFFHEQACSIIQQSSGVQLDPNVVAAFNRVHMQFYMVAKQGVE